MPTELDDLDGPRETFDTAAIDGIDLGHFGTPIQEPDVPSTDDAPATEVIVAEEDPDVREQLLGEVPEGATARGSLEEVAERLDAGAPAVIVMGPSCVSPAGLEAAEQLVHGHAGRAAVLVVDELDTSILQQALRAGVRDVLTLHGDPGQVAAAVDRLVAGLDQGAAAPPPAPVAAPPAALADVPDLHGRVITVFSTKGGAGKSVLSTNLAVTLAQRTQEPVVLVDADLQFGDVAVMLKINPVHTIVDAVSSLDRLDAALLESLLVTHEPSGLRVLPAPLEPAFADQVGAAEMVSIVDLLRTFHGYVVVDTPAYFNEVVLGLVEVSDDVVLVAGMDIPNIKNVKIGLQTLRLLNTPMEKLQLVLNRSNSKVKLDINEVERTLQVKADALIPSDVLVPQSVNKGVPVVLHAPRSGVTKAIQQLSDRFVPSAAPVRRRR